MAQQGSGKKPTANMTPGEYDSQLDRPVLARVSEPASRGAADPELPATAREFLKKYCHRCHGVRFEVPGYNVLDRDTLIAKRGEGEHPYVVPGKPEESELWRRLGEEKDMPPSGPKPSDDERALIRSWIAAGALFPRDERRKPVGDAEVLGPIVEHLRKLDPTDRPHWRYFTLATLHNNPKISDDEIRLARAGVSKLLNSLSSRREDRRPRGHRSRAGCPGDRRHRPGVGCPRGLGPDPQGVPLRPELPQPALERPAA